MARHVFLVLAGAALAGLLLVPAASSVQDAIPGRVVFASAAAHGDFDLYVGAGDTSGAVRVTSARRDEFSPSWSPDGRRIAYRVNRPGTDQGDIWVMNADGTGKWNLTRTQVSAEWSPAWSPDGARIAYFAAGDVWTMAPDGSAKRNLTNGVTQLSEYPTWSPDGSRIAFNSYPGNFEIYRMNADGSGLVNLTQSPQSSDEWPQWSPDGTAIAFRSDRDGNAEIYTMRPDGTGQVNLSRSPLDEDFPAWTADGRIGFQREGELWVMNRDGSDQQRVAGQAAFPAWTATAPAPPLAPDALVPTDGVAGMIEALDRYPLVAFGEQHGNELQHAFLRRLLRDASFRRIVDDVVVEFGNARYQRLVDRFVNGERVPISRVQHAWLDTTQRPSRVWAAPMYRRFFETVRSVNRGRPRADRVRVVLGDPPIDWSKVRTRADWERWIGRRGTHYIKVVERQVLAKGHHALLIAGAFHLLRLGSDHENETAVLERRHPGSTYVVFPDAGFDPNASGAAEPEARLAAAGPAPWLARLSGTWAGSLDAGLWGLDEGAAIGDRADALLYLGPS